MTNLYDVMEDYYLTNADRKLSQESIAYYREGMKKFHQAMVLVSKATYHRTGKHMAVPFYLEQEGNA